MRCVIYQKRNLVFFNPPLPETENIEDFYEEISDNDLEGHGIEKITIPSNIIDICTRLEILLGVKLSGYFDILTEASNLIDEVYKRGEIQNEKQYRNAPNELNSQRLELSSKI